jgi:DNA-binding MarR family transcriptional regulator
MDYPSQAAELILLLNQLIHHPGWDTTDQVTRGEGALLYYLVRCHNGATAGELRQKLNVGSSRVANALKHLEAQGLICRQASQQDGRVVEVYLTQEGHNAIQRRYQCLRDHYAQLLEQLGEQDSRQLLQLTRKLILAADQLSAVEPAHKAAPSTIAPGAAPRADPVRRDSHG